MNLSDKLKRLKDEVNRLFHEGLDEEAVIDRLRTVEQFSGISYEQVQALYSNLQEESNTEAESKRQIMEKNQQITERQQKIAERQQKIAKYERVLAKRQQLKTELEFMDKHRQNSNKFLIYDKVFVNQVCYTHLWQGRFLISIKIDIVTHCFYTIKVYDLFQDAAKFFTIQKAGFRLRIYELKFPFVLYHEYDASNHVTDICLMKFDFESESLQVVQSLKFDGFHFGLVNASDPSKFLLAGGDNINECNLIGDQIQIGRRLDVDPNFDISRGSYYDKQVCVLQYEVSRNNLFENWQLIQVKMLVYSLEQNKHSTQDIDSTPEIVDCFNIDFSNCFEWMRDTVFVTVQFRLTEKYSVIFTNPKARNWTIVEFATDLKIDYIQSFIDGTLMVCSEGEKRKRKFYKRRVYKLQMRKPDFLRNMAWNAMIKLFKEAKVSNPYEEARQYLPLNSELQPFVFTED